MAGGEVPGDPASPKAARCRRATALPALGSSPRVGTRVCPGPLPCPVGGDMRARLPTHVQTRKRGRRAGGRAHAAGRGGGSAGRGAPPAGQPPAARALCAPAGRRDAYFSQSGRERGVGPGRAAWGPSASPSSRRSPPQPPSQTWRAQPAPATGTPQVRDPSAGSRGKVGPRATDQVAARAHSAPSLQPPFARPRPGALGRRSRVAELRTLTLFPERGERVPGWRAEDGEPRGLAPGTRPPSKALD